MNHIACYYTLASAQLSVTLLPEQFKKKLPRYPSVPAVRMERLAVDNKHKGQGLGSTLLINAIYRILKSDIASYAILVDAKDDKTIAFYRHHGFLDLDIKQRTLFVPLLKFAKTFS